MNAQRKGGIGGQIVLGILVCLLVWELTGNLTKRETGLQREMERIRTDSKKGGAEGEKG